MEEICYSHARANLARVMDRVIADRTPVLVARRKGHAVVIVPLDVWNAAQKEPEACTRPEMRIMRTLKAAK